MVRSKFWIRLLTALLVVAGTANPAGAVNLWNGNGTTGGTTNVTTGGLTITVTGCTARVGGTLMNAALGGCGALNLQLLVTTAVGGEPEVEIIGASGGSIFSTATTLTAANGTKISEGAGVDDLTVVLKVTSSSKTVNNVGAIITGSDTGASRTNAELADLTMGETIGSTTPTGSGHINGLNLSQLPSGIYSGSAMARTNLTVDGTSGTGVINSSNFTTTKDIKLNPPGNADTLVLSSVSQLFREVPEPASFAVLAVGIGGLLFARRRAAFRTRGR